MFGPASEFPTCTLDQNIDVAGMELRYLQGLVGKFYDGINHDTYMSAFVDPLIDFGDAEAAIGTKRCGGADSFSARWTGYVKAEYSEDYTFQALSGDWGRAHARAFLLVSPVPGGFPAAIAPAFRWSASSYATAYALIVDDDPALSSPVIDETGLSGTRHESIAAVLAPGSVYYWRVTATNANGATVASNADLSFVTSARATDLDWDGDGISNLDEYLDGTDPDHNNYPGITGGTGSCASRGEGRVPSFEPWLFLLMLVGLRRRSACRVVERQS
jgi:hypothetical protein